MICLSTRSRMCVLIFSSAVVIYNLRSSWALSGLWNKTWVSHAGARAQKWLLLFIGNWISDRFCSPNFGSSWLLPLYFVLYSYFFGCFDECVPRVAHLFAAPRHYRVISFVALFFVCLKLSKSICKLRKLSSHRGGSASSSMRFLNR